MNASMIFLTFCALSPLLNGQTAFKGWYAGFSVGYTQIRIPNENIEMEGIQFSRVNAKTDRGALKGYGGYWISPNFGFEVAFSSLGEADATFDYTVFPAEAGTGHTRVSIQNGIFAFQFAHEFKSMTLFASVGIQAWTHTYDSRFRLSTGENQYRSLSREGNSFYGGAGMEWPIRDKWHLRVEVNVYKMDIANAKMILLGTTYRL